MLNSDANFEFSFLKNLLDLGHENLLNIVGCRLETVQNFLIKLGIKPRMHIWEISIISQIMNKDDINWAHIYQTK